ncbi:hypothetical protein RKD32_004340 [Streptomyces sp. SAI-195]
MAAAVGPLVLAGALGGAHERYLCFVDQHDERREHRAGRRLETPVHLVHGALDHLGHLDDVLIRRPLDQGRGEAVEHVPVARALEVAHEELHGLVQGQPQGQGAQGHCLALVRQPGDEEVALVEGQCGGVAAQVLAPRGLALDVVGGHRVVGDQRRRPDRLVQRARVSHPQPHRAGGLGDGDEYLVFVPGQVLGELAPLGLHLVRGHPGGKRHVDLDTASGDGDRSEHRGAGVAHFLDGAGQGRDAEVAQGLDHDGRRDRLPLAVADVGGQGPGGGGVLLAADRPQGEQGEERADRQGRTPHHLHDADQQGDEVDRGRQRRDHVPDVAGADGHDDAEGDQDTDAHPGADGDTLGGLDRGVQEVHAAVVAGGAEALQPLLPLFRRFEVPGGFGRADHPLVAGAGTAVPCTAGHDPPAVEGVEAVPGRRADRGPGRLVRDAGLDGAAGADPQRYRAGRGRVGDDREQGGGGVGGRWVGGLVEVDDVSRHAGSAPDCPDPGRE